MKTNRLTLVVTALAFFVCGTGFSVASACQVPVFRYALERWMADEYELLILHSEPMSDEDHRLVESISEAKARRSVNSNLRVISLAASSDRVLKQLWVDQGSPKEPLMVLLYPRSASEVPDRVALAVPLNDESVSRLLTSPVRDLLAQKLSSGDSAVWIFVPSGNVELDQVALKVLEEQLPVNASQLTLPSMDEMELEPEILEKIKIDLRIGFSVVTLDRDDPQEQMTLQILLRSEADLEDLKEPMAFPVFGRGRVLYALIGAGISGENIRRASTFIVGPCSCQVKNQNPGFDLLMQHDWESSVGEVRISDPLPDESSEPVLLKIPTGRPSR